MAEAVHLRSPELAQSGIDPMQDLPSPDIRFWLPRHKAAVVSAVRSGVLTIDDASRRYMLTEEEFHSWDEAFNVYGVIGLRTSQRERRRVPRQAVSEAATASLHAGASVDCVISNISDTGARLRFGTAVALPGLFEVHCKKSGRSWWVNLAWQTDRIVGVRFSNPLPAPWTIKSGLAAWLMGKRRTVSIDRIDRP
jgi:hypothetical protein